MSVCCECWVLCLSLISKPRREGGLDTPWLSSKEEQKRLKKNMIELKENCCILLQQTQDMSGRRQFREWGVMQYLSNADFFVQ